MKKSYFKAVTAALLAFIVAFSCMSFALAAEIKIVTPPKKTILYEGIDWSYNKTGKISLIRGIDLSVMVLSYNSKTVEYKVTNKFPNMYASSVAGGWTVGDNATKIGCTDFPSSAYTTLTLKFVAVDSISIINPPKKTILFEDKDWVLSGLGDVEFTELDLSGLVLKVKYKNGTIKNISYDDNKLISWSVPKGVDSAKPGYTTLYATFCGLRSPFTVNFLAKDAYLYGDANGDFKINSIDALAVLQHSVGNITLKDKNLTQADVTKDGKINSLDALNILQFTVGIQQTL